MGIFDILYPKEQTTQEVEREPSWPELIFGDGMTAQLVEVSAGGYDDNGLDLVKVVFRPTESLMNKYDIRASDYDAYESTITKTYPHMYHRILNSDPVDARHMILCCYDETPGPLMSENDHLHETIRFLKRKLSTMKANVALTQQDMDETLNQAEYRDKKMMDRVKLMRGQINPVREEEGHVDTTYTEGQ